MSEWTVIRFFFLFDLAIVELVDWALYNVN